MLLPLKALGLARNSETSIWSSETPGRCVRAGDLRQRVAGADAVLVGTRRLRRARGGGARRSRAAAEASLPARGCAAARRSRASARAASRAASRASRAVTARRGAGAQAASGAGGAAEITGDVEVPGAGGAAARIVAGGSNSSVYSRTSRPVAHEISRMTSTNGSWTPRSLTRRTNRRPSARFSKRRARARQHRVVVDVGGAIGLGRRDADAQAGLLFGRQAGDFDLGAQHFAERRLDAEAAEAEGRRERRRETERCGRTLVSAKRPENFSFLFKASPGMDSTGSQSSVPISTRPLMRPSKRRAAKAEMTITSVRYGDKLMHWLTFSQAPVPSLLHAVVAVRQRSSAALEALRSRFEQDSQHAPQRLGRAPQQLVADRERAEVARRPSPACAGGRPGSSSSRSPPPASARACVASRVFGTTCTHSLSAAIMASISASGTSRFSLIVSAWLWQRIAPTRTQIESIGTGAARRRRRGRGSCWSRRRPSTPRGSCRRRGRRRSTGSGCRRAARRSARSRPRASPRWRSRSRAVDLEDRRLRIGEQLAHLGVAARRTASAARACAAAPPPDAAW